jgi:DNA-binding MarR family transcriptional regulator
MTDAGGDPACWASRVCPACGRLDERAPAQRDGRCPHCGADPDGDDRVGTAVEGELTDEDYRRLLELRDGLRAFLHWSDLQARAAGITAAQHQLLLAVRGHVGDPPTVGDIADHLLIRHHSAGALVDRAVVAGLLSRERDPDDRRVMRLALTPRGEQVLAALTAEHKEELERIGLEYRDLGHDLPGR